MNFTRAVIRKGRSTGFYIPSVIQDKYGIAEKQPVFFEKTRGGISGYFEDADGRKMREISKSGERPAGGNYLFIVIPKGWIKSQRIHVVWDETRLKIKEIDE